MSVENLKKRLKNILEKDDSTVVSINGKWGVGKTYFWNEFKEELINQKTAYISLFGKEKISDIRTDIFLQVISKREEAVKNFKALFKGIKVPYVNISALITLLDNQDFKDIIVCFDDFERLSSSMKLEEILGFISELKEQKNCKVVMILNKGELGDNKAILDKYKEKLIDYEFDYNPKPSESLEILKDKLTIFTSYPLEDYLTKHKINNIRVISRIINALNDFSFIQPCIKDTPEVTIEIVGSIIEIAAINAQISSFSEFMEYVCEKSSSRPKETKFTENEKYEELLSLIDGDDCNKPYFLQSDIVSNLIKYCQTSLVNEESFVKIVQPKIENQYLYSVYKSIREKHDKDLYDMSYKVEEYVSDLWNILNAKGSEIIIAKDTYLHSQSFICYIEQLEKLDVENKEKYHNFAIECLKEFIQSNLYWMKDKDDRLNGPQQILDFDQELSRYYKKHVENNYRESVNSIQKIIILMSNEENCDHNQRLESLSQLQQGEIKEYMLFSAEYLKEVHRFLRSYGLGTQFNIYVKNVVSALRELSQSENKDYAHKAQHMVDDLEKNNKISKS
ncbi:hypothetical protein BHECKSOX2_688 [Bathymodiolus heckerae thiotrophic gill symbiont]|uniref:P-loop NTPase fold protein n=1 Tax=Bathymodiolus heckerae thiotrophic gill symbiont TaxID=1052212 RepID=UPI0010B3FBB2|nr:P-loop NTPase fold protein [Bathymodiolus heckerae thiotrophic gill symbiont]SMN13565.1 hypothetical protein BHECKSOX2_688 [Bathymodiolus heckerae thiotrophic gill symbiont]